jgi:hypothetical protein
LLSTLILIGFGNVLVVGEGEARLVGWVGLAAVLYAAVMYVGPTAYFFALAPLTEFQWAVAAGVAAAALVPCAILGRRPGGRPS